MSAFLGMDPRYESNTYETINDVDGLPDSVKAGFNKVMDTVKQRVSLLDNPAVDQLLNAYIYGAADCIVNFSAEMKIINQPMLDSVLQLPLSFH